VNRERGLSQALCNIDLAKLQFMDAKMTIRQWVVAQRFACSEAATVETSEIKFCLFSEACGQNPFGGESGQTVQQAGFPQAGLDVSAFQHAADCAGAGLIGCLSRGTKRPILGNPDYETFRLNADRWVIVQI
jgi:hypothetical protein